MRDFKQLLCAIDLSESADKVINKAQNIVLGKDIALTIMHVAEEDQLSFLNFIFNTEDKTTNESVLTKIQTSLLDKKHKLLPAGINASTVIEQGKVSDAINKLAAQINTNLLLIGAYSNHSLQNLFLGSTALKVLRNSICPVLVIKNKNPNHYQRVLVGVDFSQDVGTTISLVQHIAPNAEIVLTHFYDIPFEGILNHYAEFEDSQLNTYRTEIREDALKQMHAIADAAKLDPLTTSIVVVQGDAVEKILFFAQDYDCDLLVLGKHGKNLAEEFLLGSVTNKIVNLCSQDVLVMTDQQNNYS
jgi:universal stress protein E